MLHPTIPDIFDQREGKMLHPTIPDIFDQREGKTLKIFFIQGRGTFGGGDANGTQVSMCVCVCVEKCLKNVGMYTLSFVHCGSFGAYLSEGGYFFFLLPKPSLSLPFRKFVLETIFWRFFFLCSCKFNIKIKV